MGECAEKLVVITGASQGIGEALCRVLASQRPSRRVYKKYNVM